LNRRSLDLKPDTNTCVIILIQQFSLPLLANLAREMRILEFLRQKSN